MNKLDKYINKLSKIKYNISHPKYDMYSQKIGYYMTGGAITNSQLMSLIVMYLLIENSPESSKTTSVPDSDTKAKAKKEKKAKKERDLSTSTASTAAAYVSPSKPSTTQQDIIDEKINKLFKQFDKQILKYNFNNQEKNIMNSKKNSVKRLIKNDEKIRQQLEFDKINLSNIPESKLLILKALLLSENIQDIPAINKEDLKAKDASINKQEAKEYVQEKQRKIREEELRQQREKEIADRERYNSYECREERKYFPSYALSSYC
jgi:hypothetical protein